MGSAASSVGSPPGSTPSLNQNNPTTPVHSNTSITRSRKASSAPKKQSNGFIVLSYAPTNTPLIRKRGRIKTGFPEHGLIQDKYFLIKDHFDGVDRLNTLQSCGAPNFRKAGGLYPVYGMGQPSKDGLALVIETLINNGHRVGSANELNFTRMWYIPKGQQTAGNWRGLPKLEAITHPLVLPLAEIPVSFNIRLQFNPFLGGGNDKYINPPNINKR